MWIDVRPPAGLEERIQTGVAVLLCILNTFAKDPDDT
jgi:hypothetical protein